ncbi:hypothetical protein BS50DRAFT_481771 [Corynespora cassiicola Philippines]|uniref:SUZ domain-containing protein n=1 Tax=Corynespora cassiicola Philippines TaxID=1448308 RepID=A0A2T2P6R2_CORCC|nr:hypothetical protein BS50DRAFT_481771 [Corynespora cassiicola Philippines]
MPPKKILVSDAWDDDWESLADKQDNVEQKNAPIPEPKITKAELKAKHAELNRQIWEAAENPEPMLFLEARSPTPVQPTFKPPVTVLARKPPPKLLSRNGATAGMAGLNLDDDEDSEEERRKKNEAEFEERKARAQRERAEKERRYAEAREKIFGSPAASEGSRGNSPNKSSRGKGRGRGGRDSQPRSSNEQSPARPSASGRQLYDPSYSPKPSSAYVQKRDSNNSRPGTPSDQEKPIREPRGPQAIGRGGRGFAPRGFHAGPSA